MKKDLNSPHIHKTDHSLPRSKILRGRKNFQRLFEKSTVLNSRSFQFRFRIYSDPDEGCYIGFVAPKKKISKAVKRNRVKRLLKEAYRTRQSHLEDLFRTESFGFHGLFLANGPDLAHADIASEMDKILTEVRNRLLKIMSSGSQIVTPSDSQNNAEFK